MVVLIYLIASSLILSVTGAKYDPKALRCLVCLRTVEEMEKELSKISPTRKINVGGYRIDDAGKLTQKTVPLAKSELQLTDTMDTICNKLDDYARGVHKKTKQLVLLKLITDDGKMNDEMSNVDLIQDEDLNKSLKFYCEGIVDDFHDDFIKVFKEHDEDLDLKLCAEAAKLCEFELDDSVEREEL